MPLTHAKTAFLDSLGTFGVDCTRPTGATTRRSRTRSRRATRRPSRRPAGRRSPSRTPCRSRSPSPGRKSVPVEGTDYELEHGSVVIAAITSCTNTSNPQVMVGAGLLAKKAVELGLERKPWVKSSLAPGSKVVTEYYEQGRPDRVPRAARLLHGRLRLHDVHRQLGAAARGDLGGRRRGRPRRLRRALRQPQLRGAHPSRGEGELPRVAAARRRVRARRAGWTSTS